MNAEAQMKFLGEFFSVKWYLADKGFKVPGIYYWNGKNNVLVKPQDAKDKRILTLEAALEKAKKCLSDGHTQQCDMRDSTSEYPHCTCGHDEQCDEALAAIREALSTSPISPPQGAGVAGDRDGNQP